MITDLPAHGFEGVSKYFNKSMTYLLNQLNNDKGVFSTAPATLGLLLIFDAMILVVTKYNQNPPKINTNTINQPKSRKCCVSLSFVWVGWGLLESVRVCTGSLGFQYVHLGLLGVTWVRLGPMGLLKLN